MAAFPRYDEIQQRAVHNSYDKAEQLLDQLLFHRARAVEFDLHKWFAVGCPYQPPPDWGIYHVTPGELGYNVCRLGEVLLLLQAFQAADPTHEVVTVHLELKSRDTEGPAIRTFDRYSPDDLDARLTGALDRRNVFTPADLLAANPGAASLLEAVNRAGTGAGGWPTIDRLRGKFIFVAHARQDNPEIDEYATAANANRRVCFTMRETVGQTDPSVRQHGHVVFHGEVANARALQLRSQFPGLILRSLDAEDPASFVNAQGSSCNLILTDRVDVHLDAWARTHNDHRFPFGRAGRRGDDAWNDPSVRDLQERRPFHVFTTHSGDVWDSADSCSFAHTRSFPPRAVAGVQQDEWSAMLASASNNTVDGWGKCLLMARDGLHPGARYFAVGRAADDHGLFVQWRERDGGDTSQTQLGDYTFRIDGHDSHLDAESVHWVRLLVQEMPFGQKRFVGSGSIDGRRWRPIAERVLSGEFAYRGLAACGQFSRHADSPGVEYTIVNLRRNGNLPSDFEVVQIGTATFSRLDLYGERPRRRSVSLAQTNRVDNEVVLSREQRPGGTALCHADDHLFIWSDVRVASSVTFLAEPRDYEAPVLQWTVGGVAVPAAPRGELAVRVEQRTVRIAYVVDGRAHTLVLSSRPEDGTYSVEVQVRATEQDGSGATTSGRLPFSVRGRRTGFGSDYHTFVTGCLRQQLGKLRVRPTEIIRPKPGTPEDPRVSVIDEARLDRVIRDIAARQPEIANQLRELGRQIEATIPR
jgi:hypothetical protein